MEGKLREGFHMQRRMGFMVSVPLQPIRAHPRPHGMQGGATPGTVYDALPLSAADSPDLDMTL